jgi:putative alpha-1,2-mannosidase
MFCDAYYRGVEGIDYPWAFRALYKETRGEQYEQFFRTGACERTTHTLDLAECCGNVSDIADELGLCDISAALRPWAGNWRTAFDPETGVLKEGYEYYEGNHWNYAFRPLRDMEARIEEFGGREKFEQLLDRFFGYTDIESTKTRFEGFNNETDMETPYAYIFADRHDRLSEILHECTSRVFGLGKGALPGNNDSGGLSSWYVLSCLGIYPLTGTPYCLLTTPKVNRAEFNIGEKKLVIEVEREDASAIYPAGYEFDGKAFAEPYLELAQIRNGGVLKFILKNKPQKESITPDWL